MRVSEMYCPWIDKDLKSLMRTKGRLKTAALKSKSPIIMDSYRQIRNWVNFINNQLKKHHYSDKISSDKGNLKDSWKTINELLNKRSKSCNIDCLKDSGNVVTHTKDIANVMNNYCCSIGTELANKIDSSSNSLLSGSIISMINLKNLILGLLMYKLSGTHTLKQKHQRALGMTTYPISF